MDLRLRQYSSNDAEAVAGVRTAVRAVDGDGWMPGLDQLEADRLAFCGLAEYDGEVVAYTWGDWWVESDGTRLYLLLGWVAPSHRGRGFGREILAWQEDRAREHAAANPHDGSTCLGGNANDDQPLVRDLLLAAGYRVAFTRVQLELELTATQPQLALPLGVELRAATEADHRAVFDGNAVVFQHSSLGYTQDTFEEFEQDATDHDLWTLAWAGNDLAGWVISAVESDGSADTPWVGVRPEWRRRGLASALLLANHRRLFDRGVRTARIWTIAENPTGSVALYEGLGYRIVVRQPRYRKPLS